MERVYNFSAGPSMLPLEVLEDAKKQFVDYNNYGLSVMEMSHRSPMFEKIIHDAEASLRELMNISDEYSVLFLQGGGSTQFAMVPLNLMSKNKKADYVNTGQWSSKAIEEASLYGDVNVVASSKEDIFNNIPKLDSSKFNQDADYFYITLNNTIYGTRFTDKNIPTMINNIPLVGDISSNILAEKIDVNKFGLLFAGAQKNLGPSGVTIAIVRKDLQGKHMPITPTMLRYDIHAKNDSLYNTPPTFGIYFMSLVFEWVKKIGGVSAMEQINIEKANILYDFLDNSNMFSGTVVKEDRSLMNIPFVTNSDELNNKFLKEVEAKGFINLKGHRAVGGMRASIYNAMPVEGVEKLVEVMGKFETENK